MLAFAGYFFTPPAGAHPANPNVPINLNYLYGFNDRQPQTWVNQNFYFIGWLGVLWLAAFLPTHLTLLKIFAKPRRFISPIPSEDRSFEPEVKRNVEPNGQ